MTDTEEVTAAAAQGAAAAVQAVQDDQRQEETVERAEVAADIAAVNAEEAQQEAASAGSVAGMAVEAAVESQQTAQEAAQVATAAAEHSMSLEDRVGQMEARQEEFFTEARGFFTRLEERAQGNDSDVTEVSVENAPSQNSETTASEGTGSADNSGQQSTARNRRHRFGHSRG